MNNKTLQALSELTKQPSERKPSILAYIAEKLTSPGENDLKRLARDTMPQEPESLLLNLHDQGLLLGLLGR